MQQIILTQNDFGMCIQNQFMADKKTPLDITGYTVDITTVAPDGTKYYRSGQIVNALTGNTEYVLIEEDTSQVGLHKMYWSIKDNNENISAQNMLTYYVQAILGGA